MITAYLSTDLQTWRSLGTEMTLLRSMENRLVRWIVLSPRSLDMGGGNGFSYVEHSKK